MFKFIMFSAVMFVAVGCASGPSYIQLQKDLDVSEARTRELAAQVEYLQAESLHAASDKDMCEKALAKLRSLSDDVEKLAKDAYTEVKPVVIQGAKDAYDWTKRAIMDDNKKK